MFNYHTLCGLDALYIIIDREFFRIGLIVFYKNLFSIYFCKKCYLIFFTKKNIFSCKKICRDSYCGCGVSGQEYNFRSSFHYRDGTSRFAKAIGDLY